MISEIDLIEIFGAVDRIGNDARRRLEGPAVLAHVPVRYRERDRTLQPLQRAHDQRAVRPWASIRHVEVIAPVRRGEAAFTRRPWSAVRRDPITIRRFPTNEPATGAFSVVPFVLPDSIHQYAHSDSPLCYLFFVDSTIGPRLRHLFHGRR